MPSYDYKCQGCDYLFEHSQSMSSDPLVECPKCHQPTLKRLIGRGSGIIFKGSGWYCKEYPKDDGKSKRLKKENGGGPKGGE